MRARAKHLPLRARCPAQVPRGAQKQVIVDRHFINVLVDDSLLNLRTCRCIRVLFARDGRSLCCTLAECQAAGAQPIYRWTELVPYILQLQV